VTYSHDELREALGAYVLDQLDPDLRDEVDRHLTTCAACRADLAEIAPLAAVLRDVDPDAVRPTGIAPPAELDERIRQALPAASRTTARRWVPAAAAALGVAAATAAVTALVVRDDPARDDTAPTVIAVPRVESSPGVTASAGLVDHTWGLEIKLQATGLAAGERFHMWVVADDGEEHDAGELLGVAGTTITCDMPSSVLLDEAASFRVVDASGEAVISGDVPS
jgi:anti-sigma factor RsiW